MVSDVSDVMIQLKDLAEDLVVDGENYEYEKGIGIWERFLLQQPESEMDESTENFFHR